jgi:four helix bundle protein
VNGGLVSIRDERPHKKLEVWQKAMALVARIYSLTKGFPKSEAYGLSSQMRRSAISIPANIAEGQQGNLKPNFSNSYTSLRAR